MRVSARPPSRAVACLCFGDRVPPETLDLCTRFKLDHWTFTVGSDNVLDTRPGRANGTSNTGANDSLFSPMSWNGRYVYGSANFRW